MASSQAKSAALEALTASSDAISVKALLDLQKMDQASPALSGSLAAALCLIAGPGDSAVKVDPSGLARAAWPELRALVMKPGHIISAIRNFDTAVTGGRVRDNNVQASRRCLEAAALAVPADEATWILEEAATVKALQQWVRSAWAYFEVAAGSPRAAPTGVAEAPSGPPVFSGVVPEVDYAEGQQPGSRTASTKTTRTTPNSSQRRAPLAAKARPVQTSTPKSPSVEVNSRPAPVPVRGGSPPSPTVQSPPPERLSLSVGGYGAARRKPTQMDIENLRYKLAQLRKDTRAMKGLEASIKWEMAREEERVKSKEQKQDCLEYIKAKQELEQGLNENARQALDISLHQELADRKQYQEFKRAVRTQENNDEKQRITTDYLEQKDYSEWQAQNSRMQHAERIKSDIEAHLETRNFIAEFRAEEKQRQEVEELEDRLEAEHDNLQLAYNQVVREREDAIDALEYARARQQVPVPPDQHVPVWFASKT